MLWLITMLSAIEVSNVQACRGGLGRGLASVAGESVDSIADLATRVSRIGSRSSGSPRRLSQLQDDLSILSGELADVSNSASKGSSKSNSLGSLPGAVAKSGGKTSKTGNAVGEVVESLEDILETTFVDRAIWHAGGARTSAGHKFRGIPNVAIPVKRLGLDTLDDILTSTQKMRGKWHAKELPGTIVYISPSLVKGFNPASVVNAYDGALGQINAVARASRSVDDIADSPWTRMLEYVARYGRYRKSNPKTAFLIDGLTIGSSVTVIEGALFGWKLGHLKAENVNITRLLNVTRQRLTESKDEVLKERQRDIYDESIIAFTQVYLLKRIQKMLGIAVDIEQIGNSTYLLHQLRAVQEIEGGQEPLTYKEFFTLLGANPTQLDHLAHSYAMVQANDAEVVARTPSRLELLAGKGEEQETTDENESDEKESIEEYIEREGHFDPSLDVDFESYKEKFWPTGQFESLWLQALSLAPQIVSPELLKTDDHASLLEPDKDE